MVTDLKEVFDFADSGNLPVRAHGTLWISHKHKALQRVIDCYGAYLNHLQAPAEDTTIKSVDRQCLKGYLLKWKEKLVLHYTLIFFNHLPSLAFPYKMIALILLQSLLKSHRSLKN